MATRIGKEQSANRNLILDTVETLMLEEGYAAVTIRRVAAEAGLKHPLVHYYFSTTDDLFVAVYRRTVEHVLKLLDEALAAERPLRALWKFATESSRTTIAVEFAALANHRKVIADEIASYSDQIRNRHVTVLSHFIDKAEINRTACPPVGLAVIMVGIARVLVMEEGIGITLGHPQARAIVEELINQHEPVSRKRGSPARGRKSASK